MVWANTANQSTTVATLASQLISDLQFNVKSQNGSSIEIDQLKISTGTYENTVDWGDGEGTDPGADTYSVSLPYSGAGNSTFVVSSTAGTVGGDDPSTTASGTITISGIPAGTDITVTMDDTANGGVCNLTRYVSSPSCEPVGTVDLALQGILDLSLPSTDGKAFHVVANADIPDLSVYGIGVANNGGGTDGQEYTFDAISVQSGDCLLYTSPSPRD